MAIATLDQYIAAASQRVSLMKTASRTATVVTAYGVFDLAGNPGAGVLAGTSTTAGVVPTDATAGFPIINAFGVGNTGYISNIAFGSTVACRITLFDCLFKAGAYNAAAATVNLTAQPSYSSRVLDGTDFSNTEIWVESVSAPTGTTTMTVTYTNQSGTAGKTTGGVSLGAAPPLGKMVQLPLAAGDSGVQVIQSVVTAGGTGTLNFNVLVLRRLWSGRVNSINGGDTHDMLKTGLPIIFADSALMAVVIPDSTATGIFELNLELVNG